MSFFGRAMAKLGYVPAKAINSAYRGAARGRLDADWAVSVLSADQEVRSSLRAMRARSRQLVNNNDYAIRFVNKVKENVVGSNGITLQMLLDPKAPGAAKYNQAIEDAWKRFCECVTADRTMTFLDYCQLAMTSQVADGELFTHNIKGYPFAPSRFALQLIDPDQVDIMLNRLRRPGAQDGENEIRMGVELDPWRRRVAYWAYDGHPSEFAGVVRKRIPAEQIEHVYTFKRINQTRGVPFFHTAMTRMHMLGGYEEAELVAARLAACKMAIITSKTGEEFAGRRGATSGAVEMTAEPGSFDQLPVDMDFKPLDWQHPNSAFPDFERAMLRGIAVGLNVSYSSISGDLREVNFSSLRQGVLDEREGWKVLQTFARDHICKPVFEAWLPMALTSGELDLPAKLPLDEVIRAASWTSRGWDWVDPMKDVQADIMGIRSGLGTYQLACAKRGLDYRDVFAQRAKEDQEARDLGLALDLSTSGSGGIEGDTAADEPQRGVVPPKPGNKPPANKPNGLDAEILNDFVRLPQ